MKSITMLFVMVISCLIASSLQADIYEWNDENGVRYFTNYAPPDDAKIIMKTKEVPYDEAADRARREAEERQRTELERLELAEREADLERREAEAQRRLIEADREAEEMLQEAEEILESSQDDRHSYRTFGWGGFRRGYTYNGFYQVSPFLNEHPYNRWYYRGNRGSIYYTTPHKKNHRRDRYYRKKHFYGYKKSYPHTIRHHKQSYRSKQHFKSRGGIHSARGRVGGGGIRAGFRR
ncbi:MAG: DUF4124 domain-containing protein [Desulfobacterales bacterium]